MNRQKVLDGEASAHRDAEALVAVPGGWDTSTPDQFLARFLRDPDYLRIHARWTASGFKKSESPSVDRIDPRVPYRLENIRIVPWPDNHAKGATTDRELGTVDPAQWCPDSCSGYAGGPDNLEVIQENEEIPDWL